MTLQIEKSHPQFALENLHFLTVCSPALKRRGDITVFVSPDCENLENLPVVLLLHGVYDSHWAWVFKGGAHKIALELIEQSKIQPIINLK